MGVVVLEREEELEEEGELRTWKGNQTRITHMMMLRGRVNG